MSQKTKKEKKVDEHALAFVLKLVISIVVVFVVALGMDIYHAALFVSKLYAGSV